jgi:hypothetical protein
MGWAQDATPAFAVNWVEFATPITAVEIGKPSV